MVDERKTNQLRVHEKLLNRELCHESKVDHASRLVNSEQ